MLNNLNTSIVKLNDTINSFREEVINNYTQLVTLNSKIILLEEENKKFKMDIEDSQRRSRLNNVEVISLPNPNGILTDESMTLEVLNLIGLNLTPVDIEACHVVPSKRKDGKCVTVCRFLSRKVKESVFTAKKGKRDIKYAGNIIFINQQLTPGSRRLFNIAGTKKKGISIGNLYGPKMGLFFLEKMSNLTL